VEDKVERDPKKGRGDQPRTGGVKTGEAEVSEELPGAGGKFRDDLSRRDGNRICSVEPFAGANPRDDECELERRTDQIGYLECRMVQLKQRARSEAADGRGTEKRVDRNHAANRQCEGEALWRETLRELQRERCDHAAARPGRPPRVFDF